MTNNALEVPRRVYSDSVLQQLKVAYHKTIKTAEAALAEQKAYYLRCRVELDQAERRDKERLERMKSQALAALQELSESIPAENTHFAGPDTKMLLREPIDPEMSNQDAAALVVSYFGQAGATTGDVYPEIARSGHTIMNSRQPKKTLSNALKAALVKGDLIKVGDRFFYQNQKGDLQ